MTFYSPTKWIIKDGEVHEVEIIKHTCDIPLALALDGSFQWTFLPCDVFDTREEAQSALNKRTKQQFVQKCGELLQIAKPNLVSTEYWLGKDLSKRRLARRDPEGEYVLIICKNGCSYDIDISGDSLCAIASAIFQAIVGMRSTYWLGKDLPKI